MQQILSDHNCEGQAELLFQTLRYTGYLSFMAMELLNFADIGLPHSTDDEVVWQLCQERGYLLLTGNRTGTDQDEALEFVIRRYVTPNTLPVITISNLKRIKPNPLYRKRCAESLAEMVFDLARYRGVTRLFIPG
ncbi:MAG: ACP S-malonyltransferase [Caldilinea sp. CFX5]|nr:ACP S-malonyltransferase [Caldilinea sp. CFX5]